MSNSIFSTDPTTHQSSLSKVNIGASEDASLIVLGKVTKVYYHLGTLDFKLTSGVSSIVADGSGNGTGSARIPLDYFGQDGEGHTYGHYRPVQVGDTVAIAYLHGHKTSPIVIGVYAPNGEQYEAISPTLFDSGDDKDNYIAETGLAEQHVHHSGQISYRSGSGRLFESLNGYSYMVIDDDTSQDYSQLYVDLSLVPYSTIGGETREPQQEKAGDWLLVHEDNPNGLNADNHITRFYVNKAGEFELVFTNTSFAGVSTVLHMDKNGMKLNKYIGHQSKKAGLHRVNEEDRTITADFDSAPTTVTFDLGETKEDRISLKSSTTVDSKEQATNLEVRTDGVYINDVKLFDSNSNSLAALSMFLDGVVMDFSKITVKNFSGDNIEDGTIKGTKLKDKTVTADKLNISKLSDISPDMGTITAGSIQVNNGTKGSTGVSISGDASSDPSILTAHDKAQLQQQLNALYSQCQALMDYGNTVGLDVSELKTNENSLKNLTNWIFETKGNVTVDRVKIDEAITNFTGLLETYRNKFTSQVNQKVAETSNKANSIYQGSQAPDQANVKEGDLWLQTNSDGTSNIMQYTNGVWEEADLKGYHDAITAAKKAQDIADKLPHNYYQSTEPSGTEYNDGDLWYQNVSSTSDDKIKYNIYKWDISSKKWVQFIDNNANINYVANSAPADPSDGDFWTDTDGTLKQYQNGAWKTIPTQGPKGADGISTYVWIKYATSESGANMSDSPVGATYIGIATGKTSSNESSVPTDYKWTKIKGEQGVAGSPGKDGKTPYVHIAYANSKDGKTDFTTDGTTASKATIGNNPYQYMGTYVDYNQDSSNDPAMYTWTMIYDKSKKRNFTDQPTTPYNIGDTWTQSGATYFCTTNRLTGSFNASDWTLQQLTIQSLDSDLQANINGTKNLLMVDDITYYSSPALDSTNTYNEGYPFDYTSTDTTYVFQVQAKSTVNGDYVNMYPAWGSAYGQSQDRTSKVEVTTSPSVPNQTGTFTSADSNIKLALTTDWVTYKCVISGTWDKGTVLTALLGRVYNSETKGTVSFRNIKLVAGNAITDYTSDDSITVAQGSNYWDLTTLQKISLGNSNPMYYTPWYPISEGQRVFLTHYDYPSYSGITTSASVEFADSDHNFISNGTDNQQGNSTLDGKNSTFIAPQSLNGVYYNERMLNISIVSEAYTSGTYQDLYIQTSGLLQSKLAVSGRGTTVATFDPYSGQRVDTKYWDTFGSVDNANALVKYLGSIAKQDLVVAIATKDAFIGGSNDFQIASQNLCTVLQSMGLPSTYTPADLQWRVSFAFVGHTPAYQGDTNESIVRSSKGDGQVSTLNAYVSNGHIYNANNTGPVNQNTNIKIPGGGVNLLLGTRDFSGDWYNIYNGWTKTGDTYNGLSIAETNDDWLSPSQFYPVKQGETYTFSLFARYTSGTGSSIIYVMLDFNQENGHAQAWVNPSYKECSLDTNWKKYSVTFAVTQDGYIKPRMARANRNTNTLQVCGLMLEKGTVAHDWSPNPSDSTYASWLQNKYQKGLVAYANAPAKTAYFRAGYSFSPDEVNRANFMVTVDKLSTNYSSSIADVSSNAVRKNVAYKGVTLNDNGLTATAGNTQVAVNSTDGFEIKKSGTNVFSVDTNGNLTITGSTISTGNISGVDFQGNSLTLSGMLTVNGSIVAANKAFTINQDGLVVSPVGGGSVTISKGGLTITGESAGKQGTVGTYGSNDSLAGDAGLFATKDKTGATKTWITSSGTLVAQDAVIHGNVSVDNLTLTSPSSKIMFGSGFKIDGNGAMTITSKSSISNGTYSDGTIEGSELDIGTAYHSKLSDADKYRYHVSNIGETTFGMSQDLGLMSSTQGINESYLSLDNTWTQGQINFRGSGQAPTNAIRALGVTSDIYTDSYGWKHRFSAPVWGSSDIFNTISIWDQNLSGNMDHYTINYNIIDPITSSVNQSMNSNGNNGWGGAGTFKWTLSTVEFPNLVGSMFRFGSAMDLYPAQNQTIKLFANVTYVFGAYIWNCGLHGGARVSIGVSTSDSISSMQNYDYIRGNIINYQQSGYSICTYTPTSDVYVHRIYVEAGADGSTQGYDYGVPLSVTDPFAVPLNQFTSKLIGGGLDTLTSLGGRFGMPYPHLDASQHGVLGLVRADNLTAGDKVVVSLPINYASGTMANFSQISLGLAKPGNDDNYIQFDDLEFQPLMPGYYTYDFSFVWKDEYENYINNNVVQLNLISKGIGSGEKAYVVSVDSVRMGIFVGTNTTSSTRYLNEYQTKFSPLGSLQLSHISNVGENGYTIAGQTQLTSEGLTINSAFSTTGSDRGGLHISINGKSGISLSGNMNYGNPDAQSMLSFYGYVPYNTLLEHTIEPAYKSGWDALNSASGIWFDSYGNVHGYDSSKYLRVRSPSDTTQMSIPLCDGNGYRFDLSNSNGQPGDNPLKIGLVHFNKFGGGYVPGNYPAIYSGSGDSLAGIAFGAGYVIIFGNRNKNNNFWSFPQGTSDGHYSDSGSVDEISNTNY